jgi:hypothetical protein
MKVMTVSVHTHSDDSNYGHANEENTGKHSMFTNRILLVSVCKYASVVVQNC